MGQVLIQTPTVWTTQGTQKACPHRSAGPPRRCRRWCRRRLRRLWAAPSGTRESYRSVESLPSSVSTEITWVSYAPADRGTSGRGRTLARNRCVRRTHPADGAPAAVRVAEACPGVLGHLAAMPTAAECVAGCTPGHNRLASHGLRTRLPSGWACCVGNDTASIGSMVCKFAALEHSAFLYGRGPDCRGAWW